MRLMQKVRSSFDSGSAATQCLGGWRYRPHILHHNTVTCFCIPSVMSTWERMQLTHMFVGFGGMDTPHRQHKLRSDHGKGMLKGWLLDDTKRPESFRTLVSCFIQEEEEEGFTERRGKEDRHVKRHSHMALRLLWLKCRCCRNAIE